MQNASKASVITNLDHLLSVQDDWQRLWSTCERSTPFQAPGWLIPFVQVFSPEEIRVFLVWRGDDLIGLFPFWIDRSSGRPILKILGHGVSDYLDGLCEERELLHIAPLIENWFRAELVECDFAEFGQLKEDAVLTALPRREIFDEEITPGEVCPILALPTPALISAFPPEMKKNLEFGIREARKKGSLELEVADDHSFDAAMEDLYVLHGKRWRLRGLPGVFATEDQRAFYRGAFKSLHSASAARLFSLRLADRPIATLAALLQNGVLYYYIGAFDPDYGKLSPGNLMILRVMEFALRAGYHSFDFLRGQEPYKYRWGARDRQTWVRKISLKRQWHDIAGPLSY